LAQVISLDQATRLCRSQGRLYQRTVFAYQRQTSGMGARCAVPLPQGDFLNGLATVTSDNGPSKTKESGDVICSTTSLACGFSAMQGWRKTMEDAHLVAPPLKGLGWRSISVFGVLDGHGGEQVAQFCARHLPVAISGHDSKHVKDALVRAYEQMDEMLADPSYMEDLRSCVRSKSRLDASCSVNADTIGCTAVVCCVSCDSIVVANAGDSRAVLCRKGKAINMSTDHKPELSSERGRIAKAGGTVEARYMGRETLYRVNGVLGVSRAIGDLAYKRDRSLAPKDQMVSCTPDVTTYKRQAGDEFIVLACDGVWDVMSSQDVVDHVREMLDSVVGGSQKLSAIAESVLDRCLSEVDPSLQFGRGGDNMTIVIVAFQGVPRAYTRQFTSSFDLGMAAMFRNKVRKLTN